MLQDYLVRDLEDLEIESKDWDSVKAIREHKGIQTLLKVCVGRVMRIEGELFGEGSQALDEQAIRGLIRERGAYYAIADLMMNPPTEEFEDE